VLCDVVADQTHAFDAVDAAFGRFVDIPVLKPGFASRLGVGFASERDDEVDVTLASFDRQAVVSVAPRRRWSM
jgi:hypothetical protein